MCELIIKLNGSLIDCQKLAESIGVETINGFHRLDESLYSALATIASGQAIVFHGEDRSIFKNTDYTTSFKMFLNSIPKENITQAYCLEFLAHAKKQVADLGTPKQMYLVQSFFDRDLSYDDFMAYELAKQARIEFSRNVKSIVSKARDFETGRPLQLSFKIFKIMQNHFYVSSNAIFNDAEQALLKDKKVFEIKELLQKAGVEDTKCPKSNRFVWEDENYYILKGTAVKDYNTNNLIFIGFKKLTHYSWSNKTNIHRIVLSHDTYNDRLALHATDAFGNRGTTETMSRKVMTRVVKSLQAKKCPEIAKWAIDLLALSKIDDA